MSDERVVYVSAAWFEHLETYLAADERFVLPECEPVLFNPDAPPTIAHLALQTLAGKRLVFMPPELRNGLEVCRCGARGNGPHERDGVYYCGSCRRPLTERSQQNYIRLFGDPLADRKESTT